MWNRTTKLMEAMTDRHCAMENTVKASVRDAQNKNEAVVRRLELLEGKFASANFSLSLSLSLALSLSLSLQHEDLRQRWRGTEASPRGRWMECRPAPRRDARLVTGFRPRPPTRVRDHPSHQVRGGVLRLVRAAKIVTGQRRRGKTLLRHDEPKPRTPQAGPTGRQNQKAHHRRRGRPPAHRDRVRDRQLVVQWGQNRLGGHLDPGRRHFRDRGVGTLLMLGELDEVLATWPTAEINTVHAALLRTLEIVEDHLGGGEPQTALAPLQSGQCRP